MDGPLLLALARAKHLAGCDGVEAVLVGRGFLALAWAPDRRQAFPNHGWNWVFLLSPQPELWLLHDKDAAFAVLKARTQKDLSRRWAAELKGARLEAVEGDPRERWLGLDFQRRTLTGRMEQTRLSFQGIPGRSGLRLDGTDVLTEVRLGLGQLFPPQPGEPQGESPALLRWREHWGDRLEEALQGQLPDVLPGEGSLLDRHHAWSLTRAQRLLLDPQKEGRERQLRLERTRLERYGEALAKDRARHGAALHLREKAVQLSAELYRLKGRSGRVELADGTSLELPEGIKAEDAVQRWFGAVKRAERGLARVTELETERARQLLELGARSPEDVENGQKDPGGKKGQPSAAGSPKPNAKKSGKQMDKDTKRQDGKGKAFRSQMVDGFEVLIGKGDADNDTLTFKVANPCDFWLHVASEPGSQVIIRNPDKLSEVPREVMERAAQLAAFFSKARDGGKVEVHTCRVADISKPRGFAPGKVMLKTYKSLRVYPKE